MEMAKQIKSSAATAVIQLTLGENPEDRALTSIHVTQNCQTQIYKLQHTHITTRVTTFRENLEMSGNFAAVREMSRNWPFVWEL